MTAVPSIPLLRGKISDEEIVRRAGVGLQSIFSFGAQRGDCVVAKVAEQIRAL